MDIGDEKKMGGGRLENMKQGVHEEDNDDTPLPGFRFHPTDEELVAFYLRRKVEKKPISIEIIKQIDIYKYDPWDLPKGSNVGDKEWYFFCRRGRKYRNSIRPNRVTGSGFWKATGIDRPIYSEGRRDHCVGLKKSLVYYRGSAGKGTKTDWMMHEFRLPPLDYHPNQKASKIILPSDGVQEAEVWTLCRILKRNTSHKKSVPDWRELPTSKRNNQVSIDANSKTCSVESDNNRQGITISFQNTPVITQQMINEQKPVVFSNNYVPELNHMVTGPAKNINTQYQQAPSSTVLSAYSNFSSPEILNEFVQYGDWDELRTFVEFAGDQSMMI